MHIVVFGGGMQGQVIAKNLVNRVEKPKVSIADIKRSSHIPENVDYLEVNVLDKTAVAAALQSVDVAVLAVPSSIAKEALENILKTGTSVADVCFTPEPPLDLDKLAKKNKACCVVDVGIAPGVSHILAGHAYEELGGLDSIKIFVGGLPQEAPAVFHHAVYFNPSDLLSEYVRPARARLDGKEISPEPLKFEYEKFQDQKLGELEAFLSDGLRTLLTSFKDVPEMYEKTLRYPGHLQTMEHLNELGLLSDEHMNNTADALGEKYNAESYPDYLLMYVEARKGDKKKCWRLLDKKVDKESAMSRTTGYTTAAVAMLLARKQFNEAGVHAPERLGQEKSLTETVLKDLCEHGVKVEDLLVSV